MPRHRHIQLNSAIRGAELWKLGPPQSPRTATDLQVIARQDAGTLSGSLSGHKIQFSALLPSLKEGPQAVGVISTWQTSREASRNLDPLSCDLRKGPSLCVM